MSFISPNTIVNDHFKILNSRVFYRDFVNVPILNPVGANEPQISFTRSSTATRINSSGLIETVNSDIPRFDFDPITKVCRGLLIEEQRTNQIVRSELFTDAIWVKEGTPPITVSQNSTTSPTGTLSASTIIPPAATGTFRLRAGGSGFNMGAASLTFSCYFKQHSSLVQTLSVGFTDLQTGDCNISVDLANKTVSAGTLNGSWTNRAFGTEDVGNGWFRVWITGTKIATAGLSIYIQWSGSGDGVNGWFMYGAQLEGGRFPTSYIPTLTGIQVTRAVDHCTLPSAEFNKIYNYAEGSFFFEGRGGNESNQNGYGRMISYQDQRTILAREGGNNVGSWNGTVSYVISAPDPTSNFIKCMMGYTPTTRKISAAGSAPAGGATGLDVSAASFGISFGGNTGNTSTNKLNGHISQVAYYNRILSDEMFRKMTA